MTLICVASFADKMPDEKFLNWQEKEELANLDWQLKAANKRFNEATTQHQINCATYEVQAVRTKISEFWERVRG